MTREGVRQVPAGPDPGQHDPTRLVQAYALDQRPYPQTCRVHRPQGAAKSAAGGLARSGLTVVQSHVGVAHPDRLQRPQVGMTHDQQLLQQPPQSGVVLDRCLHGVTVPHPRRDVGVSSTTMATRLIRTTLVTVPVQVRRLGVVPFKEAWELQREIHAAVVSGDMPDTLLLLEHPDVYTAGRRTQPEDMPLDGTPVVEVDRGGRITWHGPGQLVGYPILRLSEPMDVVGHVRRLEELLIGTCEHFGVNAQRVAGRSGVWVDGVPQRKIAAIGVRVARAVTMHGFALNVNADLHAYDRIVPCGISDAGVTSLRAETGTSFEMDAVAESIMQSVEILLPAAART